MRLKRAKKCAHLKQAMICLAWSMPSNNYRIVYKTHLKFNLTIPCLLCFSTSVNMLARAFPWLRLLKNPVKTGEKYNFLVLRSDFQMLVIHPKSGYSWGISVQVQVQTFCMLLERVNFLVNYFKVNTFYKFNLWENTSH